MSCSTEVLGAQPLWGMVLIPASSLQLIWTSCRRGYILIWRPLFFLRTSQFRTQFNPSTAKVISWYSSTGCTCYLHRCISYFDSLAGSEVNIQQLYIINWIDMIIKSSQHCVGHMKTLNCCFDLIRSPQQWSPLLYRRRISTLGRRGPGGEHEHCKSKNVTTRQLQNW